MNSNLAGRRAVTLLVAAALLASVPLGANAAIKQKMRNGTVIASIAAPPPAGVGWQAYYTFDVPQGQNLLFSYICPDSAPTPVANSFSPTASTKVGLSLVASYRQANKQKQWTWAINWPTGSPANSRIVFNVYCVQ